MSGKFDSCQGNVRDFTKSRGKILVREKWPKTVNCSLHICVHSWLCWTCAFNFAFTPCIVAFLPPPLTITLVPTWQHGQACREPSGKCHGIVSDFHIVWRVVILCVIFDNLRICSIWHLYFLVYLFFGSCQKLRNIVSDVCATGRPCWLLKALFSLVVHPFVRPFVCYQTCEHDI